MNYNDLTNEENYYVPCFLNLAQELTWNEIAVLLNIINFNKMKKNWCVDTIKNYAKVSESTVHRSIRKFRKIGLLDDKTISIDKLKELVHLCNEEANKGCQKDSVTETPQDKESNGGVTETPQSDKIDEKGVTKRPLDTDFEGKGVTETEGGCHKDTPRGVTEIPFNKEYNKDNIINKNFIDNNNILKEEKVKKEESVNNNYVLEDNFVNKQEKSDNIKIFNKKEIERLPKTLDTINSLVEDIDKYQFVDVDDVDEYLEVIYHNINYQHQMGNIQDEEMNKMKNDAFNVAITYKRQLNFEEAV